MCADGSLNVFLHDPTGFVLISYSLQEVTKIGVDFDTTPSWLSSWLDNPLISNVSQSELIRSEKTAKLFHQFLHKCFQFSLWCIRESFLDWPPPRSFCWICKTVPFTQQIINVVRNSVQQAWNEFRVGFHLFKKLAWQNEDSSFNDCNADKDFD